VRQDVSLVHAGVLPIEEGTELLPEPEPLRHYRLVDHEKKDGIEGLFTVVGVKYTTARDVAERTISRIAPKFEKCDRTGSKSASEPLPGGDIRDFDAFVKDSKAAAPKELNEAVVNNLLYGYGTEHKAVLGLGGKDASLLKPVGGSPAVIGAEVVHAVRSEMAQTLADVVFRRTSLGGLGIPDDGVLKNCAELMARERGWDKARIEKEIADLKASVIRVS